MKIWIDNVKPAPKGYVWLTTEDAIKFLNNYCIFFNTTWIIMKNPHTFPNIEEININHDFNDRNNHSEILKWLKDNYHYFPIGIHGENPKGAKFVRTIIQQNRWKEVL